VSAGRPAPHPTAPACVPSASDTSYSYSAAATCCCRQLEPVAAVLDAVMRGAGSASELTLPRDLHAVVRLLLLLLPVLPAAGQPSWPPQTTAATLCEKRLTDRPPPCAAGCWQLPVVLGADLQGQQAGAAAAGDGHAHAELAGGWCHGPPHGLFRAGPCSVAVAYWHC
jgi:hypothetical protein